MKYVIIATIATAIVVVALYALPSRTPVYYTQVPESNPVIASTTPQPVAMDQVEVTTPVPAPVPKVKSPHLEPTAALMRICSCESTGRPGNVPKQFNADGTVLRGKVNPQDIGACQINAHYHEAEATAKGYDIYTLEGNIGYAVDLYNQKGARPWSWSAQCHGQY